MSKSENNGEAVWRRWGTLLGDDRLSNKISAVLGHGSPKHPFKLRRDGWPAYAVLLLEFMEMTPRKSWPLELRQRIEEASTPGN